VARRLGVGSRIVISLDRYGNTVAPRSLALSEWNDADRFAYGDASSCPPSALASSGEYLPQLGVFGLECTETRLL
jgi:hypothetical protein